MGDHRYHDQTAGVLFSQQLLDRDGFQELGTKQPTAYQQQDHVAVLGWRYLIVDTVSAAGLPMPNGIVEQRVDLP